MLFDIAEIVVMKVVVDKWSIEKEERNLKRTGLNLIPLDYGSADIVSTDEKVRFGKPSDGPFPVKEDPISIRA